MIKILLLSSVAIFLSGCDLFEKNILNEIEDTSKELQNCLANQVLEEDCDDIRKKIKIINLELEKSENPPTNKQTKAAYKLGKLKATGDPEKSIYMQVKRSLDGFPSEMGYSPVKLTSTNFLIFTEGCYKLPMNNWQRYTNRYKDGEVFVFFVKLKGNCFEIKDLSEKFSILTEEQVDGINKKNVKVLKFESWDEAKEAALKY